MPLALERSELNALLTLHYLFFDRPQHLARLTRIFGDARSVLRDANPDLLANRGFPASVLNRLYQASRPSPRLIARAIAWLEEPCHRLVRLGDAEYPDLLTKIHDPPPLLFCDGDFSLLRSSQLAIVGSRRTSMVGRRHALRFAAELSKAGLTITSGLALGIDAAAHEGALAECGKTIAVMGCGCEIDYPAANRRLARKIREHGLVISEFPIGSKAEPHHFPQRNRIVTGMSLGTLVIEATLKSGSLISARLANEQGKEVFAIPGPVDGPHHRGCHQLIRDGVKLTETPTDVLEELTGFEPVAAIDGAIDRDLTGTKKALVTLMGAGAANIDELAESIDLPVSEILVHIIELEIAGIIVQDAGGYTIAG